MKKHLIILFTFFTLTVVYGQTWTPINSPTTKAIFSCSFVSQDTGWVICGPIPLGPGDSIYKTTNGGITWTLQNFPPPPSNNVRLFNSVHFINSNVGIIGCGNYLYTGSNSALVSTILWTNDGGNNWVYKDMGSQGYDLDARLASPTTAYSIGQYGECKKTTNGGNTWNVVNYTGPYSGNRLFPINNDTVYFAGLDNLNFLGGAFGKTISGGSNWTVATISSNLSMNAIYFHDYLKGWIAGSGGEVRYTNNGGINWTLATTGISSSINDMVFTDTLNGWAAVSDGKIIHTIDGGLTWYIEYNGTIPLRSISFNKTNNVGYAVGNSGRILKYNLVTGIKNIDKSFTSHAFPNPFSISTTLHTDNNFNDATLTIYNSFGQAVKKIASLSGKTITFYRDNLPSGLYFSVLSQDEKIIAENKLVITDN